MLSADIRYAFRMMRRTPLLTSAVLLTIALAIGANTAIFSVVNAVMLNPFPFYRSDRIVQIAEKNDKLNLSNFGASIPNFVSWREQIHTFQEISILGWTNFTVTGGSGDPEQVTGLRMSSAFMRVLGVNPVAGRNFTDEEEKPGTPPVAMISEGFWKRRYNSDPNLLGHTIIVDSVPATLVGIAPKSLYLFNNADVFLPVTIDLQTERRLNHVWVVFGRLKDGATLRDAQAEMDTITRRVGQQYPEVKDWGAGLVSLFDTFVTPELKTGLVVLMWAVVFVLLIACANIANLLLARAAAREVEMATRTAMGANRRRLLIQSLVESITLSVCGGVIGIGLGLWAVYLSPKLIPPDLLPLPEVPVDAKVLIFAVILTVVTGLIFGIVPALRASNTDLNSVLKQMGRGSTGKMRARFRDGLAAAELALATILLIGAGLMIQTLLNLKHTQLGFNAHGLITFELGPPAAKYPGDKAPLFYRSLLETLEALPGVKGAAISSAVPLGGGNYTTTPMIPDGQSALPPGESIPIDWRLVSPNYFKTFDIPLLRGRAFTDADGPSAPRVAIVSETTAKKLWGDTDPIGRALHRTADPKTVFTVVGVVGNVHNTAINTESPAIYYPTAWRVWPRMDVVVKTDGSPDALLPMIRQKVHEQDAEIAMAKIRTMDEYLSLTSASPRMNAILLGAFSVIALMIAAIGIYGVLAYSVNQRTREIGLRMALGAEPRNVMRLVVGEGMTVGLVGIVIGLLGGLAMGRTVASIVYGVPAHDPLTFTIVALALALVAFAACVIPARRAAAVDPMIALRYE